MTGDGSALRGATAWLNSLLADSLMITICSIAIAVLGVAMLTGRFEVRRGASLVVGCFVVLGASTIAAGLVGRSSTLVAAFEAPITPSPPATLPQKRSRQTDDPYAGASLAQ